MKLNQSTTPAGKKDYLLNLPYYLTSQLEKYLAIRQAVKPETIYRCCIAWLRYKNALRGNRLSKAVDTLSIWEKELSISIRSNPKILASLYREMVYHDLAYAEREVHKVVFIVDCLKQKCLKIIF